MIAKLKYVCAQCGSENVTRNADAVWSTADQAWELSAVFDEEFCHDCDRTTNLVTKEENAT